MSWTSCEAWSSKQHSHQGDSQRMRNSWEIKGKEPALWVYVFFGVRFLLFQLFKLRTRMLILWVDRWCFFVVSFIQVAYKNDNLMCSSLSGYLGSWSSSHGQRLTSKHKGLRRMLHVLRCPIKISIPFNPSSVWILFQNVSSQLCFSFLLYFLYFEILCHWCHTLHGWAVPVKTYHFILS